MSDHTINGQDVTKDAWVSFETFMFVEFPSARKMFDDGVVTKEEIINTLDANGNGKLTYGDFYNVNSNQFSRLDVILKIHGFSIGAEAGGAVSYDENWGAVPSYMWKNGDFVLAAVKQDGIALLFADNALKKNREIVLAAVKQNGLALEYADKALKKDKEIVLAAVKQDGMAFYFADNALKKNREMVLAAVREEGMALMYADKSLKKDREIVLAAVSLDGAALEFADKSLKKDREIVLTAVKQNSVAFYFADKSLRNDPDFVFDVACVSIGILDSLYIIGTDAWTKVWPKILERYDNFKELNIPAGSLTTHGTFTAYIKEKYNIERLRHFRSIDVLIEVLKTRDNVADSKNARHWAIIISTKNDNHGAFESYPTIDRFVELGYMVVYYEAKDETEVERYLSEATGKGRKRADIIMLVGHGSERTLALDGGDPGWGSKLRNEELYIDTSDFSKDKVDINLPEYLSPNGDLILNSCWNGKGRDQNPNNLANTIARIMPQGVKIHTSSRPMHLHRIYHGDDGKLKVEWGENTLYAPNGGVENGN